MMNRISSPSSMSSPINMRQEVKDEDQEVINLSKVMTVLWMGKWVIATCVSLCLFLGAYYAFVLAVPMYRSSAVVMLETKQEAVVDLQSVVSGLSGDTTEINTELEVLKSRGLMSKVVNKLNLVADPEFNTDLKEPTALESVTENVKSHVKSLLGVVDVEVLLTEEQAQQRLHDKVVSNLLERVKFRNISLSLVFEVTAETESATKSAVIADTIVDLYILNQLDVKFDATEQATTWLTGRVAELQIQLETAEAKVSQFSSSTELVSVESLQGQEIQLKDIRERLTSAVAQLDRARELVEGLSVAEGRAAQASVSDDQRLQNLFEQGQEAAFDVAFARFQAREALKLGRLDQQVKALELSKTKLNAQILRQNEDLIALQQLNREAEAVRLLYGYFLTRLKETAAQEGIQKADSRLLSSAVIPLEPASPRKTRILVLSLLLGLILGGAVVFLRDFRRKTFRSAQELEAMSGYTVMGQLPSFPTKNRQDSIRYLAEKPSSGSAEAVRNLRTSLMLSNIDNPPQVIAVTSSLSGEGKTTSSLALAQNFGALGKRVLLVEGDIRRRTMTSQLTDVKLQKGIVSVLTGEIVWQDIVQPSTLLGCDTLSAEETTANPADLLASQKFKTLILELRDHYDVIIIDTPPLLAVPDARLIAESADVVLFSVKWDATDRNLVEEALRFLDETAGYAIGIVLTQVNLRRMGAYGYGYSYGKRGKKYYLD